MRINKCFVGGDGVDGRHFDLLSAVWTCRASVHQAILSCSLTRWVEEAHPFEVSWLMLAAVVVRGPFHDDLQSEPQTA